MKKYSELTIADDFLFTKVMSDLELLKLLLQRILPGIDLEHMRIVVREKTMDEFYDSHGIRIDIYSETDDSVFAVEMQIAVRNLPVERTRYYQSVIDLNTLKEGEDYRNLKDMYIIFICPGDPFGDKLTVYTFRNRCVENGRELKDRTTKIFINCGGENTDEYPELKPFVDYVRGRISEDGFIKKLDRSVQIAKKNPLWRKEFMDLSEKLRLSKEEGIRQNRMETFSFMISEGMSFEEACHWARLEQDEIEEARKKMGIVSDTKS